MQRALRPCWLARSLVIATGAMLLVTGCGGKTRATHAVAPTPAGVPIEGWAIAGHPLVGAKVRILDLQGHELGRAFEPTLTRGFFAARVKHLPKDFQVVATGGTDGGKPFSGELRDDVRGYQPYHTLVVGPASTLISLYTRDRKVSHREAVSRVQHYLGLPVFVNAERDLRTSDNRWFSSLTFEREAAAHGGHDAYLRRLAHEAGSRGTHRFPAAPTNDVEPVDAALNGVLAGLGQGAFKAGATDAGFGSVLVAIGLGSPDAAALQQISQQLSAIEQQLALVEGQLQALTVAVAHLQYSVDISSIAGWMSNNGLGNADLQCQGDTGTPGCLWQDYGAVVDAAAGTSSETPATAIQIFTTAIEHVRTSDGSVGGIDAMHGQLNAINDTMQGASTQSSALADWTQYFTDANRFWTSNTQASLRNPFAYWAGIEAELAVMIQEYVSYTTGSSLAADPLIPNLVPSESSQVFTEWQQAGRLVGMQSLPPYMIADAGSKTIWPQDMSKVYPPGPASWETAVDATSQAPWLASHLPAGFDYRMPSNADFVNLVSADGGFQQSWGSSPDIADYLAGLGFTDVLPWFWVSDSQQGEYEDTSGTYHNGFGMLAGEFRQECFTDGGACDIDIQDNTYVTAVADLNETPDAWYVTPPPG